MVPVICTMTFLTAFSHVHGLIGKFAVDWWPCIARNWRGNLCRLCVLFYQKEKVIGEKDSMNLRKD